MAKVAQTSQELLNQAIEAKELRFFTASRGAARGKTGPDDTAKFADHLMALHKCALLLGETLEMDAVSSAISVQGDETAGFCFDPNSDPQDPVIAGAIVNRKMEVSEFVNSIREFINSH